MSRKIAKQIAANVVFPAYAALFPASAKKFFELRYWKRQHRKQGGNLSNAHYEPLYTSVYGLSRNDYSGKRVLDIGCGPRGSLEWADMAALRVGLDPLADEYLKLGASRHKMEYRAAYSENMPFLDGTFDIVCCLNALDHVNDLGDTIREIKRVTKRGGMFLLCVEIDHAPTSTEPITINDEALKSFQPEFSLVTEFRVGTPEDHLLHNAVLNRSPQHEPGKPGIYVARYTRN